MATRALVTGGAGFIGSNLCDELLSRGFEVVVLDNLSTGNMNDVPTGVEFHKGDVRNPLDLAPIFEKGIDVVCHIAGQASVRLSFANPTDDLEVNTLGTVNVLQQCIQYRVPRLIFASSMTIYGTPQISPTTEDTTPAPVSYYGVTKYAAERYVHLTGVRKDLDFNFNVTSMRMFNVYGVRQSLTNAYQGVLAIFIGRVLRGEPIMIHSDGKQARDFVHISDVVRAWADAIDIPTTYHQVMNIGGGQATSINQLCDLVLSAFGYNRQSYQVEYGQPQAGDILISLADIGRAKQLMGWEPWMPFDQGMRETVEWAKSVIQQA